MSINSFTFRWPAGYRIGNKAERLPTLLLTLPKAGLRPGRELLCFCYFSDNQISDRPTSSMSSALPIGTGRTDGYAGVVPSAHREGHFRVQCNRPWTLCGQSRSLQPKSRPSLRHLDGSATRSWSCHSTVFRLPCEKWRDREASQKGSAKHGKSGQRYPSTLRQRSSSFLTVLAASAGRQESLYRFTTWTKILLTTMCGIYASSVWTATISRF